VLSTMMVVNTDDGGAGSLRQAITDANDNPGADIIEFAPQVKGTIGLTSGELVIDDELTINGPGQGKLTVSGRGESRVFDIVDTTVAIDKLKIADGFTQQVFEDEYNGTAGGAGIRATGSNVSLEHMVIENNRIEDTVFAAGAALQGRAGSNVSLDHVTVRNNETTGVFYAGGGAINMDGSSLSVDHSTFEGNRIANHDDPDGLSLTVGGGAIGSSWGQTEISHSRFIGNQVDGNNWRGIGGAISVSLGNSLDVDHSYFGGNSAVGLSAAGGAISNHFNWVSSTISNSNFVGNSAVAESQIRDVDGVPTVIGGDAMGGAIFNSRIFAGTLTIDNSSIVNNWVNGDVLAHGGGIYNGSETQSGGATLTLTSTNVDANRAIGDGDAVGGGVYNATDFDGNTYTINIDDSSNIHGNKASTSHDDVFGDLTLLDDLLFV
jgi:hypothetical protein